MGLACKEISEVFVRFAENPSSFPADLGYSAQRTGNVPTEVISQAAFIRFK